MGRVIDTSSGDTVRRIKKVGRYHLALFLLPVCSLLFYGWLRAPHLNERPDNPQRIAPLHLRGRILDKSGRPLADTVNETRTYPQGASAGSLIGYQLRGRNHTGLEASIQHRLSPPLPPATLAAAFSQDRQFEEGERPRLRGPDVRLTLDAELQRKLYEALLPSAGAVVVSDERGQVLAAVSSPSFDPNKVRENWQTLRDDERGPFIERVGSGFYPVTGPDGEPLVSEAELKGHNWMSSEPFPEYPGGSSAVFVDDRLFLTPLMMLEMAYWTSGREQAPSLRLLADSQDSERASKELPLPKLEVSEREGVLSFDGPSFQKSPAFLAMVGWRDGLYFAVVVESADAQGRLASERVLDILTGQVGGKKGGR